MGEARAVLRERWRWRRLGARLEWARINAASGSLLLVLSVLICIFVFLLFLSLFLELHGVT